MNKKGISNDFPGLTDILSLIDMRKAKEGHIIIAIDGNSGAGKSCLADLLADCYDCNVFHMDDFFLQPHQRTPERIHEPGGNIDYERFQSEVINNLKSGSEFRYQVYDCSQAALVKWVNVVPKKINIIEGVYSMHPLWNDIMDIRIFLSIQPEAQMERILKRSGEWMLKRFQEEWIPLENQYFEAFGIKAECDLVIDAGSIPSAP